MFGILILSTQSALGYTVLYISCTACLLFPPGPVVASPSDSMYCVTTEGCLWPDVSGKKKKTHTCSFIAPGE